MHSPGSRSQSTSRNGRELTRVWSSVCGSLLPPWPRRGLRRIRENRETKEIAVWAYWVYPFWGMPFNGARHGQPPLTPYWALESWLWEDDVNTADEVLALLAGYEKHDIPVRTILIDRPWSFATPTMRAASTSSDTDDEPPYG